MSNTKVSQLTDSDRAKLDAWCAAAREVYAEFAAPIPLGDPKRNELRASSIEQGLDHFDPNDDDWTPEELGGMYFNDFAILPGWPLEVPAWTQTVKIHPGQWPEITIELTGKEWTTIDGPAANILQLIEIDIDEDPVSYEAGPIWISARVPNKSGDRPFETAFDLGFDTAMALSIALEDAAHELVRKGDEF